MGQSVRTKLAYGYKEKRHQETSPCLKRPVEKGEIPGRRVVGDVVGPLAVDVS